MKNAITDIAGVRIGHCTDREKATGCTVVLCPEGAVASVDVRGASPGTRETDLLQPGYTVEEVHGILLTGGSAFGLEAAGGMMRYLAENGSGYRTGIRPVPIVPAAVIFDLGIGDSTAYPTAADAYMACTIASDGSVDEGSVGAGTGATAGKARGVEMATKGGLGTCSALLPSLGVVAAIMVANPLGDVVDPVTNRILAGTRRHQNGFEDSSLLLKSGFVRGTPPPTANTVIGVVATDVPLSKDQANRVAQMAHDGIARTVRPSHTLFDGDTIFVISAPGADIRKGGRASGVGPGNANAVGIAAAEVVANAILRAITLAEGLLGIPAARDLGTV